MTPKQEAALRLALETFERMGHKDSIFAGEFNGEITAIREALAEQPVQPCGYPYCGCNSKAWCKVEQQSGIKQVIELYDSPEQPAQQEPSFWMDTLDVERKTPTVISNFEKHEGASEAEKCVYPVWTSPPAQQEPVAKVCHDLDGHIGWNPKLTQLPDEGTYLYTSPQPIKPLTDREVELLDGMIEVQLDHAKRCDSIANRSMAEKQKAWDMERVELLRKLKAAHGIKE